MLALNTRPARPMARAVAGLLRAADLEPWAVEGLLDLGVERHPPGSLIEPSAERPSEAPQMKWLLDGWLCEARVLPNGVRQIFSFAVPGDVIEAPSSPRFRSVRAVTAVECVDVADLLARAANPDTFLCAVLRSLEQATERRYDHIARLAQRSAQVRLASLLVELHERLCGAGLVRSDHLQGDEFALPLRHEELADALGLSPVHVTRCLKSLREQGLLTMKFRRVSGFDRAGLEKLCV
ncbi:MAG TPA: Crp/Fnr family transcriptional regulator [Phenylobacterium sp.]|uniref:Crp/Fnr family transcriptional regulator n=1 Tax=Phenylobacterium sp. TaxID=1871053 RepID=UPI002B4A29CE|nr:Crp/Fnr family transcriptional regulator [Phenylobacterium sp.]HKR89704.1 Crp/Fnr family transcriptional regulator [Phenylobacterium sp.]